MAGGLFARKTKNMVFIFTHFTFIVVLKLGDLEMKNLTTVLHIAALGLSIMWCSSTTHRIKFSLPFTKLYQT